jgi:PAS domain S-box-containing protein
VVIDAFLKTADLLPEAMLLVSGDGLVLAANRTVARRLGLDPHGLRGRRLADVLADPPGAIAGYLRTCSRTREMVPGTLHLSRGETGTLRCHAEGAVYRPRADGADVLILLRLIPKETSISQFVALNQRIDAQAHEIRRRQRVEDELRQQREWFRVTLSSIGDAVIATDTNGRVILMNPVAESITGWLQADALGKPLEEIFRIINEETRGPVDNPVVKVLREGAVVGLANHTVLISRDGSEWSIDDTAAPIREDGGGIRGVVLIFHDIGDRRAMERELHQRAEKLAEADRRKDEFLAMLAHELRNPLAPTLNTLRVLRAPRRDEADVEWATEILERQVKHMARLVDDLLDVSRITHGKIELRKERVELAQVVAHAVEVTQPLIAERRLLLTVTLPPEPVPLEADPARLEQVLVNLLNNAAKYTDEGGLIWMEGECQGTDVVLRVRDTGVGIAPELLPSVFDLFIQADHTLARSQGGLGIGLTLVRTLVELHGGRVDVRSEGPGRGSEFTVRLPMARPQAPQRPDSPSASSRAAPRPLRVLVVDDNVDSARSLARLLGRWGHDVQVAHDGPGAIDAFGAFHPEFVILDIGLPGMDGYEIARRLRDDTDAAGMLLVALTGYGQESDRQRAFLAGFDHHLVKPVDIGMLQELLGSPGR